MSSHIPPRTMLETTITGVFGNIYAAAG